VDDIALAEKLDRARAEFSPNEKLRVLIEVHIAGEESKSVWNCRSARASRANSSTSKPVFCGIDVYSAISRSIDEARPYLHKLRELRDVLQTRLGCDLPVLSMGMSHDFEAAIEEGATEVRVGTALFGARHAP